MKPEQREKWRQVRQQGMLRYVAVNGVLSYGLVMFFVTTFIVYRDKLSTAFIAISAVAWTIGGMVFGVLMWLIQERRFRKAGGTAA